MAVNKRKLLEAARKFAQKGAKEKALKEYNTLLKADPKDAKLLLEVGDAHRRWGQTEEAIAQYTRVADQYKQGGFDARAVAVFKQILNLDPKRYPAFVSLAELYQRMGLDAEAVSALQTAADGYHKEGQKREALELLRKMATLDPSNTTSRMKVAELLSQESMIEDAVSEYEAVAEELIRQGATENITAVYERILEIAPDHQPAQIALVRVLVDQSQHHRAEPVARKLFDQAPDGEDHFELVSAIYTALEKESELTEVTRTMAKIHRDRGDEDKARELTQRLPSEEVFDVPLDGAAPADGGDDFGVAGDLGGGDISGDDLLADDDFLDDEMLDVGAGQGGGESDFVDISDDENFDLGAGAPEPDFGAPAEVVLDEPAVEEEALPEGDPDQLFAEASVYLRYGKRDQAIASFKAILNQDPSHRDALEKIGECYADGGDAAKAVDFWTRAAEEARSAGDEAALDVLRERIAVHDPAAAAELVSGPIPSALDSDVSGAGDPAADLSGVELDVDIDFGDDDASAAATPASSDAGEADAMLVDPVDVAVDLDIDIEDGGGGDDPLLGDDALSIDDMDAEESGDAIADALASSSVVGSSSTQSQQINEDLEEAEFYFAQELYDEARAIYERILKIAPNHPSAMLRLGELQAACGEDPGAPAADRDDGAASLGENSELEIAIDLDDDEESTESEGVEPASFSDAREDTTAGISDVVEAAEAGGREVSDDTEVEVALDDVEIDIAGESEADAAAVSDAAADLAGMPGRDVTETYTFDSADAIDPAELSGAGADGGFELDLSDVTEEVEQISTADEAIAVEPEVADAVETDAASAPPKPPLEETQPIVAGAQGDSQPDADDDDMFDLAAELRDSLDDETDAEETASGHGFESTSEEEGFASIFKDFKAGVDKTLSEDDFETRFDLGIAYREMELYDDAIGEFRMCLVSESHRLESLHMMGQCAMNLGRPADAVNHFEQALAMQDLPEPKRAGLHFDLGRAFELQQDWPRAKQSYESARDADPSIPGIDDQIAEVEARVNGDSGSLELADAGSTSEDEGFESFDDLVAEAQEEPVEESGEAPTAVESFESFDDVIADAEMLEAEPIIESEAEPAEAVDAEPASEKPAKPRRKKKISFV